ncbi:gamma-glutamyltransferase [Pigmentiphaga soli]|uniref:Glutathione hydrolase proenzyme n=1 Tax=Pigmentiphaga soli TaxID=1007095 RepID=A0ABP8GT60_9BURK
MRNPCRTRGRAATLACAALLAAVMARPASADGPDANPEIDTGRVERQALYARRHMAVTANPQATRAAEGVLDAGGSAVDAAIAAQMMLALTEPQSSGLGGGAFMIVYSARDDAVAVIDGRETAPAAAGGARFLRGGRPMPFPDAVDSGLSVGVPGVLRALELAHRKYGRLPWASLLQPAIDAAERGFPVSPRLARQIAGNQRLARNAAARAYFYRADGRPRAAGERLRNPALADTLRRIARGGADAFYRGPIAADIAAAVAHATPPGDMTAADLAGYRAIERPALCRPYRSYTVCGVPPPSSGGIAVQQMLTLMSHTPIRRLAPESAAAVHYFSEAGRLAYADRDRYVADPAFVDVPTDALLDPAYLARRAALIAPDRSMGHAEPGEPAPGLRQAYGADDTPELPSTTHLSIVDDDGNAVAMTSTIEQEFGSKLFVRGFLLNNELTDFALSPADDQGRPVANRVEAGKRPRSAMAPTIVLRAPGAGPRLRLLAGSPGGSAIPNYVAKMLVATLDWGLDVQSAADLPNMGSRNHATELERGTPLETLAPALQALGHRISVQPFPSGVHAIEVLGNGLLRAGVDPRRDGAAAGR